MNKKLLLAAAAVAVMTGASAYANEFNLDVNLGAPGYPGYVVAPPPAIIVPAAPLPAYYDPHHRAHDFRYWQERHRDRDWHGDRR